MTFFLVQIIPSASEGATFNYMVKCSGPCKNMKIDLKVNRDADLYARYAIEVFLNAAIPPDMIQTLTRNNCKISQLEATT